MKRKIIEAKVMLSICILVIVQYVILMCLYFDGVRLAYPFGVKIIIPNPYYGVFILLVMGYYSIQWVKTIKELRRVK